MRGVLLEGNAMPMRQDELSNRSRCASLATSSSSDDMGTTGHLTRVNGGQQVVAVGVRAPADAG
jgi:hypothetical protein